MPWEVGIDLSDGDRSVLAVAALAGATTVILLFLCCRRLCCCCGSRRSASGVGYESVPHQLDGEELDFKRAMEGDGVEGGAFTGTELEQIEMIEQYRSKLVEGAAEDSAAERGKDLSKVA
jgi:hypothetical protein